MDSELTSIASVKALDQGVATTDSPSFGGLTVDTMTLNASSITGTSNLTLDSAGDITLDADGQDIRLKDGGTEWGRLTHTGHFGIQNPVSDADIQFIGNDGGSTITALTLDMSAAGAATFNAGGTFSGNVGIGTDAPLRQLGIESTANSEISMVAGTSNNCSILMGDGKTGTDVYRGYIQYNHSNDSMLMATSSATRMTIDSSGNVGIGTNAPSSYGKFAIRGAETIGTFGEVSGHFSDAATGSMYITHASNNISLKTDGDLGLFANNADSVIISTTATERMRIDSSGNVGINTSSPDAVFTVDSNVGGSSTGTIARFHSSKGESDSTFLQIAATRHGTASVQRVQLQAFDDDGSTLRTLCLNNAGGAVLVGLSSPIVNPNTSTNGVTFGSNYTWTHVSDGGGQYSQRQANGNLFTFYRATSLVGTISVTASATAYNTSSDYRLKENVVPMTGSIDRVKALKPSRFNFIVDADNTVDGFLAHEAQEVVPECVTGTKDAMKDEEYEVTAAVEEVRDEDDNITTEAAEAVMGTRSVPDMQGIDQAKLVPLLTAALQEAIAKIEALTTRIEALEA